MTFELQSYTLRKPRLEDAEGFIRISQDEEVMKCYGAPGASIPTLEDAQKQVEWCNQQFAQNAGRWIITETSIGEYIGDIGFSDYVAPHNRVELGYRLQRAYWGKGIVTNSIGLLVQWGFAELGYNRIEALVDTRNPGSKIVLLRNLFRLEGTLRDYEFEYGHYVDLEMYALLRKDYLA